MQRIHFCIYRPQRRCAVGPPAGDVSRAQVGEVLST